MFRRVRIFRKEVFSIQDLYFNMFKIKYTKLDELLVNIPFEKGEEITIFINLESILKKIIFSILNILIVMPLSFLVLACFDKYKSKIKYIITLLIVNIFFLILELIQYFCHIGVFELIDSLMYLIGSVIAILIYINLRNKINELNINKVLFVTMFILFILSVLSIYPTIRQAEAIKYQYNLLK